MDAPAYQCHKQVRALKIKDISAGAVDVIITPEGDYGFIVVQGDWVAKHKPEVGGYYVIYEDGYKSFSPAAAFESGYTLVADEKNSLSHHDRIHALKLATGCIYRGQYNSFDEYIAELDKLTRYVQTGETGVKS
jgi:hypothetical protein